MRVLEDGKEGKALKEHSVATGTTAKDFVVVSNGYKLILQSRYRSFSLHCDAWERKQEVRIGGALASDIKLVASMADATPIPKDTKVQLCKWDAHALACDAHFPHIVSFFGAQVIPGEGEHILFTSSDDERLEIKARTDGFSRLEWLTVTRSGQEQLRAEWTRQIASREEAPAQDTLPVTVMRIADQEFADASQIVERIFLVAQKDVLCNAELLVRLQANGAASFAVRTASDDGVLAYEGFDGMLLRAADVAKTATVPAGSASGTSVYEEHVEPHLAWKRGQDTRKPASFGGVRAC